MRLTKRRTGWRRDEKKVTSPSATRSTGNCSRAIWRAICGGTLRVGQDLVEQAADDVDHHVIERAGGGLAQLVAVGADQVLRHQPPWPEITMWPRPPPVVGPDTTSGGAV